MPTYKCVFFYCCCIAEAICASDMENELTVVELSLFGFVIFRAIMIFENNSFQLFLEKMLSKKNKKEKKIQINKNIKFLKSIIKISDTVTTYIHIYIQYTFKSHIYFYYFCRNLYLLQHMFMSENPFYLYKLNYFLNQTYTHNDS